MSEKITCPACGHSFNPEEAIAKGIEEKLVREFQEKNKALASQLEKKNQDILKKFEALEESQRLFDQRQEKAREEYAQRLKEDREKIIHEARIKAEKEAADSTTLKLKELEEALGKKQKENIELQKKEIEFLKKENELKELREKLDLEVQKKMLDAKRLAEEEMSKKYAEQFELREKEYRKQLDDQKKLTEEMKRKMEQGSMQLQGEVQELAIEEDLRHVFPFDMVTEVSKGIRGADCIQVVRNERMQECGKIIYESKRAKVFSNDWIPKLKEDMRSVGADIAVLVSQVMPRDQTQFALNNGVWVCSYHEYKALAAVLRESLLRVQTTSEANTNKGEKMEMLYGYLTGNEFRQQVEAIVEGFNCLREELERERRLMEKTWKVREKQIDKVMKNTLHLYGSVKGIAGASVQEIKLLDSDPHLPEPGTED